jgi:hypothetical protein
MGRLIPAPRHNESILRTKQAKIKSELVRSLKIKKTFSANAKTPESSFSGHGDSFVDAQSRRVSNGTARG